MIEKYRGGQAPQGPDTSLDRDALDRRLQEYRTAMDRNDLKAGADAVWALVAAADLFISSTAPWSLAKAERESDLDQVLASLYRTLYRIAVLAFPFVPGKATTIWSALGQPGKPGSEGFRGLQAPSTDGVRVTRPPILFPKPAPASGA